GTTSASKAFKVSKVYVDENPFAQNANEQYMHFKSYGAATSTASIYSVTLESDLNASAVGEPAEPIDYGTVETAETNKFTWKPYDKGYMTIVYDDNNDNLEGMFNVTTKEYGFPICAAVPTKYIDRNPISLLEEIQASGGEILSHTASHPQLNFGTPWTTVEEEFKKSYDILTERGFNVNGIILSGGTNSDTSTAYGRAIEPITAKYYKYSDRYGVSPQFNKPRDSFSGMSAQQIKNIIDRMIRNKDWIVIYAHNFSEFPEAIMREVFDYAKQKQDEGVFDIVTYKYIYQNFAEFENPVDFGRDTFNVNFYGTDNKTLLGTSSVYDGDDATAPEGYVVKEGYTFSRWSQPIENVTENMNVYAICTDNATGLEIDTSHENVMVKSFDTANPVLANTKKKILSDNSLKISYLNSSSSSKAFDTTVADWLDMQFSGISVTSDNYGIIGATTALGTYAFDELYNSGNASDLVFIDYTANDTASYPTNNVWSKADIKRQAEYLVRNIYNVNPNADIVFVLDNKGDASGSYEAYMELAEEYKATGIGCLDLDGVETSDYEEKITGFLKSYLVDVYILGGELDDHESVMPAEYLSRSPWVNGRLIEASSFTTEVSNAGSAISARMVDSAVSKIELAPSSVVFSSGDKASFTFDGTGFGMVMDGVADEASVKYQIDGHGWKTMTIPENDGGIVVTFENELSYTSHEIELEFTTETMVGGAYVFGEDNGLLNITALSIDDGPKEASTGLILDVLKKYGAHATFFSIGINVKNAQGIVDTSKALLNRVLAEGSEIGNHSNSTALPDTKEGIQNHFEMAQEKIFEATGTYPVVYRSPGNDHSDAVFEAVTLPLMNGYNIGSDWNGPDAGGPSVESRINSITKNAEDGNIILIHDNVWNAEALETALPNIAAKGLKVVTVSELIRLRGYEVPAMRQYRAFWKSGWEIFAQHSSLSE
ncbi:MAG: polysaccharide deacetylase family protein, partial [Clostridia bacterium]|nr:polysaccharide deacetylase family protein [Clostridia bacterium]